MADFPIHDSPERKKPVTAQKSGVSRDKAREARQAERRARKQRDHMRLKAINEGRWQDE